MGANGTAVAVSASSTAANTAPSISRELAAPWAGDVSLGFMNGSRAGLAKLVISRLEASREIARITVKRRNQ